MKDYTYLSYDAIAAALDSGLAISTIKDAINYELEKILDHYTEIEAYVTKIELISEMQDILDEYSLLLGKERLEREEPENLVEELDNLLS